MVERAQDRSEERPRRGRDPALLKEIHDAARGLRTEMDLSADSPWARQLAAIRTEISNLLEAEIESMPGRVRRLLRPRPAKEIAAGLGARCRRRRRSRGADRLRRRLPQLCRRTRAQRDDAARLFGDCSNISKPARRRCSTAAQRRRADRRFRQSQVDAAVRFCGKVFGPDYAATLTKAAEVAGPTASARPANGLVLKRLAFSA